MWWHWLVDVVLMNGMGWDGVKLMGARRRRILAVGSSNAPAAAGPTAPHRDLPPLPNKAKVAALPLPPPTWLLPAGCVQRCAPRLKQADGFSSRSRAFLPFLPLLHLLSLLARSCCLLHLLGMSACFLVSASSLS